MSPKLAAMVTAFYVLVLVMWTWSYAEASTDVPPVTQPESVVMGPSSLEFACDGTSIRIETSNPGVLMSYTYFVVGYMTLVQVTEFVKLNAPDFAENADKIRDVCIPGKHT